MYQRTLAIDIGGTYIKYGTMEEDHSLTSCYKIPTQSISSKTGFFDYLCKNIRETGPISLIGVSSPGLIDSSFQVRTHAAPSLSALFDANIKEEIEARMSIPTAAINDAKAAGLCELKLGRAKGTKLSAFLIIGTGGGGCICTGSDVLHGIDNFAGEFHFISYYDEQSGEDIKTGRTIGMMGLIKKYNETVKPDKRTDLGKIIIDRAFSGETEAKKAIDQWIHRISLQVLNLVVILNPELVCIGGGISQEDWFLSRVKEEYKRICLSHFDGVSFLTTEIDRCLYCNQANLLGAALHANMVYHPANS